MEKPDFKKDGTKFNKKKQPPKLSKLKYNERIVQVKRVTKVVKGGKKMTFRAVVIIGDTRQKVGVGVGRADDVNLAIDKAILNAKKNLIVLPLTTNSSIPHVVQVKYGSCSVMLRPAAEGTGVIAGGAVRAVLESVGIQDVLSKSQGSSNPHNVVKATFNALFQLRDANKVAQERGISLEKVFNG